MSAPRRPPIAPPALFCSLLLAPTLAYADVCTDIARIGLVDETHQRTLADRLERIFWYSRSQSDYTHSDVESLAASARIPLAEAFARAKVSWGSQEYERITKMDEQELQTYVRHTLVASLDQRKANEGVTQLIGECLGRKGLKAWPSFGPGNLKTPALVLHYDAPPEANGKPLKVTIDYPTGLSCKSESQLVLKSGVRKTVPCIRDSELEDSVLIVVNPDDSTTVINGEVWMPPVKLPVPDCATAKDEVITLAFDKTQPWVRELGPYCGPVSVTLKATGEARRNAEGNAWSRVGLYRGKSPVMLNEVCSDRKEITTPGDTGIGAQCTPFVLPAHKRESVTVNVTDASADTDHLRWTIHISPKK